MSVAPNLCDRSVELLQACLPSDFKCLSHDSELKTPDENPGEQSSERTLGSTTFKELCSLNIPCFSTDCCEWKPAPAREVFTLENLYA